MAVRNADTAALAAGGSTAQPRHLGQETGLANEHQSGSIEIGLAVEPRLTPLSTRSIFESSAQYREGRGNPLKKSRFRLALSLRLEGKGGAAPSMPQNQQRPLGADAAFTGLGNARLPTVFVYEHLAENLLRRVEVALKPKAQRCISAILPREPVGQGCGADRPAAPGIRHAALSEGRQAAIAETSGCRNA